MDHHRTRTGKDVTSVDYNSLGFDEDATPRFDSPASVRDRLGEVQYLSNDAISSVVYLADRLRKPILVEGPAGT